MNINPVDTLVEKLNKRKKHRFTYQMAVLALIPLLSILAIVMAHRHEMAKTVTDKELITYYQDRHAAYSFFYYLSMKVDPKAAKPLIDPATLGSVEKFSYLDIGRLDSALKKYNLMFPYPKNPKDTSVSSEHFDSGDDPGDDIADPDID